MKTEEIVKYGVMDKKEDELIKEEDVIPRKIKHDIFSKTFEGAADEIPNV